MAGHVAFLLPNMGAGGAERLTIDLMAGFIARDVRVDLVLLARAGAFLSLVPEGVRVIDLAAPRLRHAFLPLRRYLRREKPDALVAAMWPLTSVAVAAAAGLHKRPRVIISDHCPLKQQYAHKLRGLRLSMRATYRYADAVVGVSDGLSEELADLAGINRARVTTIANPVPVPLTSGIDPQSLWQGRPGKRLISVGTLKPEKNHALLIDAFALLVRDQDAVLAIVGEGTTRGQLEAQVARLGLSDRVLLPGYTATPGDWYAGADLFVLSSDYEGFGNVMVEAMHFGLTAVATDCPYGPADVLGADVLGASGLTDGRWGVLVPCGDAAALAEAMKTALPNPLDPASQRTRASHYSLERAVEAYWRLMAQP